MEVRFTVGEMAKMNGLSKQMLIYYDKEGIFSPKYIDPCNKYRYYTAEQLEVLDSILVLREMGLSLKEIKAHMQKRTGAKTLEMLREQQRAVCDKIEHWSVVEKRLKRKIQSLEQFYKKQKNAFIGEREEEYLVVRAVGGKQGLLELDITLKKLLQFASEQKYPHNYQIGCIISQENIQKGKFLSYEYGFLPLENACEKENIYRKVAGLYAVRHHLGPYPNINKTYEKILKDIEKEGYKTSGPAYEYCVLDSLTSKNPEDYITEIHIPVELNNMPDQIQLL